MPLSHKNVVFNFYGLNDMMCRCVSLFLLFQLSFIADQSTIVGASRYYVHVISPLWGSYKGSALRQQNNGMHNGFFKIVFWFNIHKLTSFSHFIHSRNYWTLPATMVTYSYLGFYEYVFSSLLIICRDDQSFVLCLECSKRNFSILTDKVQPQPQTYERSRTKSMKFSGFVLMATAAHSHHISR